MFITLLELTAAGMTFGAAAMYNLHHQKRITLLIFLLFVCTFYIGLLTAGFSWLQTAETSILFDVLRFLTAAAAAVFGFMFYLPYYGFFHQRSGYLWLALTLLFFYIGWHAGHWASSLMTELLLMFLFAAAYVAGNTLQSILHFKMRGRFFVPYIPFAGLLFFSLLMLL
ncbi:hypothetical protein [Salibacterium halotolerans]|uniref:Uncharacterized protein n=1 Tax=Salibacterium halotolerans TaxID=1884432 RepID=A0A1I5NKA4_9BACI|nr:hypothetical protein [Salibacterium halotolerans]SFP22152.1 hypothetical protein SAMN05518683_103183 [Salibacterium halotolerans]